jgi:hypothetical protein
MVEPGWYPDPIGSAYFRYFNGSEWTSTTTDSELDEMPEDGAASIEINLDVNPDTRSQQVSTPPTALHAGGMGISLEGGRSIVREVREKTLGGFISEGIGHSSDVDNPVDNAWIVGQSGMVRLNNGLVEIKRTSLGIDLIAGNLRGDKAIPLRTIQAVQFKLASATVGGMIEFVVAGDRSNNGRQRLLGNGLVNTVISRRIVRIGDENVVTFNRTQEPPFKAFHQMILTELMSLGTSHSGTTSVSSISSKADEIRQLKELLDEGILTLEEFESAKKIVLNI